MRCAASRTGSASRSRRKTRWRGSAATSSPCSRPCQSLDEASELSARLEWILSSQGTKATFGWAVHPQEGENALAVYRAASERLYARKVMRGYVRGQQPQGPRAVSRAWSSGFRRSCFVSPRRPLLLEAALPRAARSASSGGGGGELGGLREGLRRAARCPELAVPQLAALVLSDRTEHRPALRITRAFCVGPRADEASVEDRLDSRLGLLCVLAAGPLDREKRSSISDTGIATVLVT